MKLLFIITVFSLTILIYLGVHYFAYLLTEGSFNPTYQGYFNKLVFFLMYYILENFYDEMGGKK